MDSVGLHRRKPPVNEAAAAASGNFPVRRRVHFVGAGVNEDVELIDDCLRGDSASFGLLVSQVSGPAVQHAVPRGRLSRRGRRRGPGGVRAGVREAGDVSTQQCVLHLAVPYRFQHGRQPQSPEDAPGCVDAARDAMGEEPMDTTEDVTERVLREERATKCGSVTAWKS